MIQLLQYYFTKNWFIKLKDWIVFEMSKYHNCRRVLNSNETCFLIEIPIWHVQAIWCPGTAFRGTVHCPFSVLAFSVTSIHFLPRFPYLNILHTVRSEIRNLFASVSTTSVLGPCCSAHIFSNSFSTVNRCRCEEVIKSWSIRKVMNWSCVFSSPCRVQKTSNPECRCSWNLSKIYFRGSSIRLLDNVGSTTPPQHHNDLYLKYLCRCDAVALCYIKLRYYF